LANEAPEASISYAEARRRIGKARFGTAWDIGLSDDEQYDLEKGPFGASSVTAYEVAKEKVDKIDWRSTCVDEWLVQRRFVDPMLLQLGMEIPLFSRAEFEKAFLEAASASEQTPAEQSVGAVAAIERKEARGGLPSLPPRHRGPNTNKTTDAAEKLRSLLRNRKVTRPELLKSVRDGGLKYEDIGELIGIGRTTVPSVIKLVLDEPEFADSPSAANRAE
jgi:DNA-directed RNA polymerase specialized sigma24 family protein